MTKLLEIDGLRVVDAKKPKKLIVTEDDCKRAKRKRPESCAIARACDRLSDVDEARVHLSRIYLKADGKWTRYLTPKDIRSEIIAFDRGGTFEPGEYWLRAIPPSETTKGRKQAYDEGRRHQYHAEGPKKKHRKPHVVTNVRTGPV